MSARDRFAYDTGNLLISVGLGLSAIADLLGADGSEHHLTHSDRNGLIHAVRALADLVKRSGYDLAEAFDPDPLPGYQAAEDLDAALSAAAAPRKRTTKEG